jgi:hypothetical protein
MVLENQINIYLAEVKAIAEANNAIASLRVDEEYANLIREVNPAVINDKNEVQISFEDYTGVNVSVDFESTRAMAKEEDLKRLNTFMTGFFEAAKSDPSMAKVMRSVMPLLMEEMTKSSNLENSAKIAATMKQALAEVAAQEAKAEAEAAQQAKDDRARAMDNVKAPTVSIAYKDLPPAGKIQAAAKYGLDLTAQDVSPSAVSNEGAQNA